MAAGLNPAFAEAPESSAVQEEATGMVTQQLARYVVSSQPSDLPQNVKQEAVRSILNYVGCAVGGSRHKTLDVALAALSEFSGPAQASLLGRSERVDILNAALMNGMSSHVLDFDDTHLKTIIHPAGPVASAILPLAEYKAVKGEDWVHAFVLGVEVECRIGNAVYPSHYDVGWHITGTAGVFGAAAAAGKLLGLDVQRMTWALGIAATQASGLREMFGTMCKSLHPGKAAQNGLSAALLASKGFTSSERSIEAPRGFAHVAATSRNLDEITRNLGKTYEVLLNTYKPFPCGIVIHPVIDGCLQLRREHDLKASAIRQVALRVNPLVLELTGRKNPQVGLETKFSVYHAAASAIVRGRTGLAEFSDEAAQDPAIVALRGKIEATADPQIREESAAIRVTLEDGRVVEKFVEHAVGSVERPMSNQDLEAKFRGLAVGVLPDAQVDRLIELCWSVEKLPEVAALARAGAAQPS